MGVFSIECYNLLNIWKVIFKFHSYMKISNPLISVVIPSRAINIRLLKQIFSCLEKQTLKDFDVVVVCDRDFKGNERKTFLNEFNDSKLDISFYSHENSDFIAHSEWWASYVRNFWIDHAKWEFIQLFDDDNEIEESYLNMAYEFYKKFKKRYWKDVFITPTLMWRDTTKIQNQWFSWYRYWQARPQVHFLEENEEYAEIKMFSWNWIFWKKEIMQKVRYDEKFAWIAEDLDFVYSIREKWYPILVFRDLKVHHRERDKTILEEAWIWNEKSAYQKIKNIFLWWKKHANLQEKIILLLRSTRWICVWLSIKTCRYAWKDKLNIICGLRKWYLKWWKLFLNS